MQFTTTLVGASHRPYDIQDIIASLEEGDWLSLEREPHNPYDQWAIKVMLGDQHLGYVAAKRALSVASEIAPYMDISPDYTCEVINGGTPNAPALRITFT